MTIYFYHVRDQYGCFSNFSPHGFSLDNFWWPTNEHYFQAQKFLEHPRYHLIRTAPSPQEAAHLGRDKDYPLRADWDAVKDGVMLKGVYQKFTTHRDLRQILLATGEELLIEDAPQDYYWGCGAGKNGKNRLGEILMQVRTLCRQSKN